MNRALGTIGLLCSLGIVFFTIPWLFTFPLAPPGKRDRMFRWLVAWSNKGWLVPVVLWALMNLGWSWRIQPFMPAVQAARNQGANWAPEYLRAMAAGLFIVSSYWSAVTLAWVLASAGRAAEESTARYFGNLCKRWLIGMSLPAIAIVWLGGLPVAGIAANLLLVPIAVLGADILQPKRPPPIYSKALARLKFGKYAEAEAEIIEELAECEEDFEGWMMLADLYANRFNNLADAERTILELCSHPATNPSQLSIALHRLADWQLKIAQDPQAARRTLQLICTRLDGTHLARMAQLRIHQLPETPEQIRKVRAGRTIALPSAADALDAPCRSGMGREQALKLAESYLALLKQNPGYVAAREKLARTLAEQLGQANRGIEHLALLLDMPGRSNSERAEWLNLTAAWQLKYCKDLKSGKEILERLIREFPGTPQAASARQRLRLLSGVQLKSN